MSNTEELLEALKKNVGEWVCVGCNSNSGQAAATFRELKKKGYVFEEYAPIRWGKSIYCPICGCKRTHYKLLSTTPMVNEKPRCSITPKQRERVLKLLEEKDAFSGSHISSTAEIDHKTPWSRLNKDINISKLTDEEIKDNFQLLTREHNLLKDRSCQLCIKKNKRPPFFGIYFWYEGNEEYKGTCVGCGWYDGIKWREMLNKKLKNYE